MTNAKQALSRTNNKANGLTKRKGDVRNILKAMQGEINDALPKYMPVDKFIRVALTAINSNPTLLECSDTSLLAAIMNAAQLGLEINSPLGEAYMIPYDNKKKGITELQFQIGYQGLLKLAHNTKQFKRITAKDVHENDEFDINYGTGEIVHKPVIRGESGDVIGYYAVYETIDGGQDIFYMSKEDAIAYGKEYSFNYQKYNSGVWADNLNAMGRKSCLKQLLKYAPRSIDKPELTQAIAFDNGIMKSTSLDVDTGARTYDIDYEVVSEEEKPIDPKTLENSDDSKNKKVDKDTGEILEDDFFSDDVVPVSENE